jgi:AcrR family transcriptional regulator
MPNPGSAQKKARAGAAPQSKAKANAPVKGKGKTKAISAIGQRRERRSVQRGADDRVQEIMAAASKVFRTVGYDAATLDDVAKEVGVDRATLYYYVSSKPDLLAKVISGPLEALMSEVRTQVGEQRSAKDKIRVIFDTQIHGMTDEYTGLDLVYEQANLQRHGEHGKALRERGLEYTRFIRQIIEEGQASGEFRTDVDSRLATMALVGMMNWMHRWYDGKPDAGEVSNTFAELALGGLLRR